MISSKHNTLSLSSADRRLGAILGLLAFAAALVAALILLFLIDESWPLLGRISPARFILDASWHPTQGLYDLSPMLSATLLASLGALLLAVPVGIGSALFGRYYAAAWLAAGYRRMIELLAGIPSVVYGFWGLTTLAPWIGRFEPPGVSLLTAILVLAIMILPTVALTTDAALAAVPQSRHRCAAALGLSRWTAISGVLLPSARKGIVSGILLAAARAVGETMAVLMVAGNVVQHPHGLFDPVRTLAANIALEMAYAGGDHRAALFASGLVLLCIVLILAGTVQWYKTRDFYDQK